MSDADLALFQQSLPRLINTAEGNKLILSTMRKIAQYDLEQGRIAQNVISGRMSRDEAYTALQGLSNPLSDFASQSSAGSQGALTTPSGIPFRVIE